jgi:4-hydroxybenzoate polyprenyltransferase
MREWLPVKLLFNLMLAAIFWNICSTSNEVSFLPVLLIVCYIFCMGAFAYFINDIFDADIDRLSGKLNYISKLPIWLKISIPLMLLGVALSLSLYLIPKANTYLILLLLHFCFIVAYSIPGVRLKRNIGGLFVDALYAYVLPGLISIEIVLQTTQLDILTIQNFMPAIMWLGFLGFRSIINHQLGDFKNDTVAGQVTYIIKIGKAKGQILSSIFVVAELIAFVVAVAFLFSYVWQIIAAAVLLFVFSEFIINGILPKKQEKKRNFLGLLNQFYDYYLLMGLMVVWARDWHIGFIYVPILFFIIRFSILKWIYYRIVLWLFYKSKGLMRRINKLR